MKNMPESDHSDLTNLENTKKSRKILKISRFGLERKEHHKQKNAKICLK